jgi:uncharacterized membrane protein
MNADSVLYAQGVGLSTSGLQQWLLSNAVTVMVLLLGLSVLLYAGKAQASKVFSVVGLALVGMGMIAMGSGGNAASVGQWVLGLVGLGGGQ